MSLATNIQGLTNVQADVDANNNLHVNPPTTVATAGFIAQAVEIDHGTVTGARKVAALTASMEARLATGMSTPLYDYQFTGASQDTGQWKCAFTLMTVTESGGYLLLNSNQTANAASGVALSTWRYFKVLGAAELWAEASVIVTSAPLAGQVIEWGFFAPTATTAPADGVYFRLTTAGLLGVLNYNGTETTLTLPSSLTVATLSDCVISVNQASAQFWVNGVLFGSIAVPAGNAQAFASAALPYSFQQRNSGAIGGGTQAQFKVGSVHVEQQDLQMGAPASHLFAAMGQSYQGLQGGTPGSLASYVNNTAPAALALSNTAALVTGLGGQAAFNPTLAANSDGIVFAYQNPVGGVGQTPRTLVITGVQLHGAVSTTLVGGNVTLAWVLNVGSTAVSLATVESASFATATAKAPRKIPIGLDTYALNAAAGVLGSADPLVLDLEQSPVVVNPGEFVIVSAKNIGTVTTGGAITELCAIKHYWI